MEKDLTIEPMYFGGEIEGYGLYEHDEFPNDSVLAGQPRRTLKDTADTAEELKESYPDAEVLDHSTKCDPIMSSTPPDWFDPMDCGEEW